MPWSTRLLIAAAGLAVLAGIIQLVRRKKLDEKRAMLWILSGALVTVAPLAIPSIDRISRAVGIDYPPALIFLLAFFALFVIVLQYAVALTRLAKQNRSLAERLAILEHDLKRRGP